MASTNSLVPTPSTNNGCYTEDVERTEDIDEVFNKIGCGLSQFLIVIIVTCIDLVYAYQMLIMYYLGNDPSWTCTRETSCDFCQQHFNKTFSVTDDDFNKRCSLNRTEWKYTTGKKYSLVTEYDLACGKEYLSSLADSAIFIGWGVGATITAILTDKYGRKKALLMSVFFMEVFAIGSCFINAMWQLIVIRTFIGVCAGTVCSAGYIYMAEFTSFKYRSLCMNIVQVFFSVVVILLSALAMYVQEWRDLELYAALPGAVAFFFMLMLPESPGWLHAMGNAEQADKVLHQVVKLNRSDAHFMLVARECDTTKEVKQYSYKDLFKESWLILFNLAQSAGWLTCGLVYYGLSLESSDLGGSIYINLMLSASADIVGCLFAIYFIDKGRRKVVLVCFALCGLIMVGLAVVQKSWNHGTLIRIILAMFGKVCIEICYCGYYIWTAELYPTVVRTQGMTICQTASRVGAAAAPFLTSSLQHIFQPLPFITMSVLSFLAMASGLILPETKGQPIREKFEDLLSSGNVVVDDDIKVLLDEA